MLAHLLTSFAEYLVRVRARARARVRAKLRVRVSLTLTLALTLALALTLTLIASDGSIAAADGAMADDGEEAGGGQG